MADSMSYQGDVLDMRERAAMTGARSVPLPSHTTGGKPDWALQEEEPDPESPGSPEAEYGDDFEEE